MALDHGTKDAGTGEQLQYPVTLLEAEDEDDEDTVFTEDDQRLVRQRLGGLEQRQGRKAAQRRRQRKGSPGASLPFPMGRAGGHGHDATK